MFLSRGGFELNEIWGGQRQLIERDEQLRSLERRHQDSPEDRAHYVRGLRRAGQHDEADKVHLHPHVEAFVGASRKAHETEGKVQDLYRELQPSREELQKAEDENDAAREAMGNARDVLHHHVAETLKARGGLEGIKGASTRYRAIMAHGAKHLPSTNGNWEHEHSMLMHYHDAHDLSYGRPVSGSAHHFRVESAAKRHALLHSLASRNPDLRIGHSHRPEHDDGHHVLVYVGHDRKPLRRPGGSVEGYHDLSSFSTKDYVENHPPHKPVEA